MSCLFRKIKNITVITKDPNNNISFIVPLCKDRPTGFLAGRSQKSLPEYNTSCTLITSTCMHKVKRSGIV